MNEYIYIWNEKLILVIMKDIMGYIRASNEMNIKTGATKLMYKLNQKMSSRLS